MDDISKVAAEVDDPERLAVLYLKKHYKGQIQYPINPFKMLVDEGIFFSLRNFKTLEGVFIPAKDDDDIPIVGINLNRPITRQRFTAAHEICHFLKDSKQYACPVYGRKSSSEIFADRFASGILMPYQELKTQVEKRLRNGYVSFDSVLEISDFFGVSFEACLFRIAYCIKAIDGNVETKELRKRIRGFKPDAKRKELGYSSIPLYDGLINSYEHNLRHKPNDYIRNVFRNEYIYNDSRLEGVDIDIVAASEMVMDIMLKRERIERNTAENEALLSIAGHAEMYQYIFEEPLREGCSVFEALTLHRKLFSHFPCPDFGGKLRDCNTLVIGAKFEILSHEEIICEMVKVDKDVKEVFRRRGEIGLSDYIKNLVQLHHRLTVIHPFTDGNGRTLRAFFNMMMVRSGFTPTYIKAEDRKEYFAALHKADEKSDYGPLYEFFYKAILRANTELTWYLY